MQTIIHQSPKCFVFAIISFGNLSASFFFYNLLKPQCTKSCIGYEYHNMNYKRARLQTSDFRLQTRQKLSGISSPFSNTTVWNAPQVPLARNAVLLRRRIFYVFLRPSNINDLYRYIYIDIKVVGPLHREYYQYVHMISKGIIIMCVTCCVRIMCSINFTLLPCQALGPWPAHIFSMAQGLVSVISSARASFLRAQCCHGNAFSSIQYRYCTYIHGNTLHTLYQKFSWQANSRRGT